MSEKKLASGKVMRNFAIGQLGWAMLSGVVSNWLLFFYTPNQETIAAGMPLRISVHHPSKPASSEGRFRMRL